MIFSNRQPKEKHFEIDKKEIQKIIKKNNKKTYRLNNNVFFRGQDHLSHPKMREMQRYGTSFVNTKKIARAICEGKAAIIEKTNSTIIAMVHYSNRFYVAVMDACMKVIKTFLPFDSVKNPLKYVQDVLDKENLLANT